MTQELWQLSATELAARIARRETTARAATESVLARIAVANPQVNALASVSAESALRAADAAGAAEAAHAEIWRRFIDAHGLLLDFLEGLLGRSGRFFATTADVAQEKQRRHGTAGQHQHDDHRQDDHLEGKLFLAF